VDVNRSAVRCLPEPVGTERESPNPPAAAENRGPSLSRLASLPLANLRPLGVEFSAGDSYVTTPPVKTEYAMRIGFNYVRELGEDGRNAIVGERERAGPYRSFDDFVNRLRGGPIG